MLIAFAMTSRASIQNATETGNDKFKRWTQAKITYVECTENRSTSNFGSREPHLLQEIAKNRDALWAEYLSFCFIFHVSLLKQFQEILPGTKQKQLFQTREGHRRLDTPEPQDTPLLSRNSKETIVRKRSSSSKYLTLGSEKAKNVL